MKRLLYIYLYCNLGGVATVIKQRLKYLNKEEYEVNLLFYKDLGGKQEWEKLGIPINIINENNKIKETLKFIQNNHYDVITIFDTPEVYNPIKNIFTGKLIYEMHSALEITLNKLPVKTVNNLDMVIVPSDYQKSLVADECNINKNIIIMNIL